jgi:hypothetical protein
MNKYINSSGKKRIMGKMPLSKNLMNDITQKRRMDRIVIN